MFETKKSRYIVGVIILIMALIAGGGVLGYFVYGPSGENGWIGAVSTMILTLGTLVVVAVFMIVMWKFMTWAESGKKAVKKQKVKGYYIADDHTAIFRTPDQSYYRLMSVDRSYTGNYQESKMIWEFKEISLDDVKNLKVKYVYY